MKKNFFKRCVCVSTALFLAFVVLYVFVLVNDSILPLARAHIGLDFHG